MYVRVYKNNEYKNANIFLKKYTFESVLMRWMKLEPIIQSEVSQKEKHQYSILTHFHFHQEALQFLFTFCHKGGVTCTPMFITALFTIARTWKQPRCPLADEWIRKLWYIYTMEYYSTIKKNAFGSVLTRWIKLESIIYRVK